MRYTMTLLLLALSLHAHAAPLAQPRNVVLVVVDTLRADRIEAKRGDVAVMPNLQRVAREGWHFQQAIAQGPWTRPSVTSILTGLYPGTHRLNRGLTLRANMRPEEMQLDGPKATTMLAATYFKSHGYSTLGVQTNQLLRGAAGYGAGFDHYEDLGNSGAHTVNAFIYGKSGVLKPPFFLYAHYMDPHAPYNPPDGHRDAFGPLPTLSPSDQAVFEQGTTFSSYYLDRILHQVGERPTRSFAALSDAGRAFTRQRYDGECHYVDHQIGRLMHEVLRHWPDTIFVITADHGEELWEHGDLGHGRTLYQELVQVPLLIWAAGITPRRIDTPVELIDILPTLATMNGLPPHPAWQGRSLANDAIPAKPVFSETEGTFTNAGVSMQAVIDGDRKLIRSVAGGTWLYDLKADPGETNDLAASAASFVAQMSELLDAHATACAAHPAALGAPTATPVSPELAEELRALGYTDTPSSR